MTLAAPPFTWQPIRVAEAITASNPGTGGATGVVVRNTTALKQFWQANADDYDPDMRRVMSVILESVAGHAIASPPFTFSPTGTETFAWPNVSLPRSAQWIAYLTDADGKALEYGNNNTLKLDYTLAQEGGTKQLAAADVDTSGTPLVETPAWQAGGSGWATVLNRVGPYSEPVGSDPAAHGNSVIEQIDRWVQDWMKEIQPILAELQYDKVHNNLTDTQRARYKGMRNEFNNIMAEHMELMAAINTVEMAPTGTKPPQNFLGTGKSYNRYLKLRFGTDHPFPLVPTTVNVTNTTFPTFKQALKALLTNLMHTRAAQMNDSVANRTKTMTIESFYKRIANKDFMWIRNYSEFGGRTLSYYDADTGSYREVPVREFHGRLTSGETPYRYVQLVGGTTTIMAENAGPYGGLPRLQPGGVEATVPNEGKVFLPGARVEKGEVAFVDPLRASNEWRPFTADGGRDGPLAERMGPFAGANMGMVAPDGVTIGLTNQWDPTGQMPIPWTPAGMKPISGTVLDGQLYRSRVLIPQWSGWGIGGGGGGGGGGGYIKLR